MKYWINRASKEHTFIVYSDKKIYRLRTKPEDIMDIRQEYLTARASAKNEVVERILYKRY